MTMVGRFSGKDIIGKPTCPFCGQGIEKPKELATRMPNEMPVGACSCGAVYACDVTGHNLGTAMIEALVFGCNGDWDLAWGLLPEDDYQEELVKNYDFDDHLIIHGGIYKGRRIGGTLYCIRLHQDIREVTEEGTRQRLAQATPVTSGSPSGKRHIKGFSKKEVEALVKDYRIEPLLEMAGQDKRIIRHLQRLIYSVDNLLRWRATDILGKVSAVIAEYDPGAISKLLQRLFTAVSDTAASSWGCIDAIGDIISNSPGRFSSYGPQLYQYAGDRALLVEVLRALGKIGRKSPDIRKRAFHFIPILQDPDPEIRSHAAILLGNLSAGEAKDDLEKLKNDTAEVEIYSDGNLELRSVGQLALEALRKL